MAHYFRGPMAIFSPELDGLLYIRCHDFVRKVGILPWWSPGAMRIVRSSVVSAPSTTKLC